MGVRHLAISLLLAVGTASSAAAQDYLAEREPKRWALVIGHSEYDALSEIPSAQEDAQRMAETLRQLHFEVQGATFADVPSFETNVLVPFAQQIARDDVVLVYFSGHGFAYSGQNFLAPTGMSQHLQARHVTEHAVAVESIEDYLACRSRGPDCQEPGLIIVLLDACRSLVGFEIEPDPQFALEGTPRPLIANAAESSAEQILDLLFGAQRAHAQPIAGGLAEPRKAEGLNVNVILGFAAKAGQIATGFDAAGQPSLLTGHLAARLPSSGVKFEELWDEVAVEVGIASADSQQPGLHDWSTALVYLNPTPAQLEDEKRVWRGALAGLRADVLRFRRRYSISRFMSEVRRWLSDHPVDEPVASFTLASPVAIERAWRPETEERVAVRRLETPVALPRVARATTAARVQERTDAQIGIVPSGTRSADLPRAVPRDDPRAPDVSFDASQLAAHRNTVIARDVVAFQAPSKKAPKARRFVRGQSLRVVQVQRGPDDTDWLKVQSAQGPVFVPAESETPSEPLELGRSLREITLSHARGRLPEIVDAAPLVAALRELRAEGRTVTWASIGVAFLDDKERDDVVAGRIDSARLSLVENGLDSGRITAVVGAADAAPDDVRVRLFGF